jgi:hypothetical protein
MLLVRDSEADKASVVMEINVGNFSDKANMPGMAHIVGLLNNLVLEGAKLVFLHLKQTVLKQGSAFLSRSESCFLATASGAKLCPRPKPKRFGKVGLFALYITGTHLGLIDSLRTYPTQSYPCFGLSVLFLKGRRRSV